MIQTLLPYLLAGSALLTYSLELWTGFAVVGLQGKNALIDRRTKPLQYWVVMAIQTLVLAFVPAVIAVAG